ncbi:MAG: ribbon-helix-helix protein, CopG family [Verrucomicrobiales bacterium]|nr:ribbon-helix-helix protein, CopG family [Verrucomicrobiales bacterium]
MKPRSPEQTAISISLPRELLARIDARARSLGMPRSRYLAHVAESDIEKGGALTVVPKAGGEEGVDIAEIAEFLELAVPALAGYEAHVIDPATRGSEPESPEIQTENEIWKHFLEERDEILKLKWIESRKAGGDIGIKKAIHLWLKHRQDWLKAHPPG